MVATFLDLNKNRPGPANIAEKIDMYDVSLSFMMWTSFFADRQKVVGMGDNPSLCTLARQIF